MSIEGQALSVRICQLCGKRILSERPGSFTQWIFRQDTCSCKNPSIVRVAQDGGAEPVGRTNANSAPSVSKHQISESTAPDFEADSSHFPLDRYTPLKKLGAGAAGDVFLCVDNTLEKMVCLKTLHTATTEALISFQKEARATCNIVHPNIVTVLDFGIADGASPYMVFAYFNGESLHNIIVEGGPLHWQYALDVVAKVGRALAYSHKHKILHGDIKPHNILVADDETGGLDIRLIDFGLSNMWQYSTIAVSGTQPDAIPGTPAYMSPDQALGYRYSELSEIYSVGCVLFECLVGHPPFQGETALATLAMHANQEVESLEDFGITDVPIEVEELMRTCLAKQPRERFVSADALVETIEALLTELTPRKEGTDRRTSRSRDSYRENAHSSKRSSSRTLDNRPRSSGRMWAIFGSRGYSDAIDYLFRFR